MKQHALTLWFAGLAALGVLRSLAAAQRHGGLDFAGKLWLAGSLGMAAIAVLLWWRQRRR